MNAIYRPPQAAPMIPENAPFSPEQRAWLNGFFAGLLSSRRRTALSFPRGKARRLRPLLPREQRRKQRKTTVPPGMIKPCRSESG